MTLKETDKVHAGIYLSSEPLIYFFPFFFTKKTYGGGILPIFLSVVLNTTCCTTCRS